MASFRDISGHSKAVKYLKRAVMTDHISHAYLICGSGASDREQIAAAFAQTLQCETLRSSLSGSVTLDEVDACGSCRSCRQAADSNMPDIISWKHEKPSTFSVDDVRSLTADIQIRPFESTRKIYIVPDADLMTVQAQNALLKALEEPPAYAHIFLLSDSSDSMLETIRSRCVTIGLEGDAEELPEELKDHILSLMPRISSLNPASAGEEALALAGHKNMAGQILDLFTSWYRDVLYYKAAGIESGLLYKESAQAIREYASAVSYKNIRAVLDALQNARLRLASNVSFEITIKLLLLAMADNS